MYQIGGDAINSLDDGTPRATVCKAFYPTLRDAVLRAYPWNCAKYRVALSPLAATPAAGGDKDWAYQYTLPTDPYCLWVPKQLNEDLEYKVEGRKLLTDEATITIVYVQKLTDVGTFDSLLTEAIVARLASQLCYPITANTNLTMTMWKLYEAKIREAQTADGQEGNVEAYASNVLVDVR